MGSHQRFDYSVLGDEVNLASRLEGQSKAYGVDVVLGLNTYERINDFAALELDLLQVKGKTKPVRIFGLLGDKTMKESDFFPKLRECHENMLTAFRNQQWEEALQWVEKALELDTPKTRLRVFYKLYTARIQSYQAHPPGPEWKGVTVALFK
jgi:adenylate cyclase